MLPVSRLAFHLLEIVYDDFFDQPLHVLLDELGVFRVRLVGLFGRFVGERQVQGDLITLFDHWPRAGDHLPGVELYDARDILKQFVGAGQQFIGGSEVGRVGPENHDV